MSALGQKRKISISALDVRFTPGSEVAALTNSDLDDVPFESDQRNHAPRHVRSTPKTDIAARASPSAALCQNVWPGHAVQDGLPRSANVRAASMYQASEVEQFAPGHHGYPRASEAD